MSVFEIVVYILAIILTAWAAWVAFFKAGRGK